MPLKNRPLDRTPGRMRDARLIVIACEDTYAVKNYFRRFKTSRLQFFVIPSTPGETSPAHVLDNLKECQTEFNFDDKDSFWLCVDRDRWPQGMLSQVVSDCRQNGFNFAISDPCFELWMLLHYKNVDPLPRITCGDATQALKLATGAGYSKTCCTTEAITSSMVHEAMARARASDSNELPIPDGNVTRIYKILDLLLERESIQFIQ